MVYCCIIWSRHHFGLHYLKPFSTFIITSGLSLFYCGYIYTHTSNCKITTCYTPIQASSFYSHIYLLTFTSYIQNHTFNHETKTFNKQTSHFHYLQLWIDCPLPILSIYLSILIFLETVQKVLSSNLLCFYSCLFYIYINMSLLEINYYYQKSNLLRFYSCLFYLFINMSLLEINYYYQKPTNCETQGQPINIPYIYIYHRVPFYVHITNIES